MDQTSELVIEEWGKNQEKKMEEKNKQMKLEKLKVKQV